MRKLQLDELGRVSVERYKALPKVPVTVVLDNIRSGLNVGSILRSCDAFSIEKVVLTGITASPPHKEILKTAIGAERSVNWTYEKDIKAYLTKASQEGKMILGIEQTDQSAKLNEVQLEPDKQYVVVFGNEVEGVSIEALHVLDTAIEIPQFGTKHSLNVAVCAGIVLWHFHTQLRAASH